MNRRGILLAATVLSPEEKSFKDFLQAHELLNFYNVSAQILRGKENTEHTLSDHVFFTMTQLLNLYVNEVNTNGLLRTAALCIERGEPIPEKIFTDKFLEAVDMQWNGAAKTLNVKIDASLDARQRAEIICQEFFVQSKACYKALMEYFECIRTRWEKDLEEAKAERKERGDIAFGVKSRLVAQAVILKIYDTFGPIQTMRFMSNMRARDKDRPPSEWSSSLENLEIGKFDCANISLSAYRMVEEALYGRSDKPLAKNYDRRDALLLAGMTAGAVAVYTSRHPTYIPAKYDGYMQQAMNAGFALGALGAVGAWKFDEIIKEQVDPAVHDTLRIISSQCHSDKELYTTIYAASRAGYKYKGKD